MKTGKPVNLRTAAGFTLPAVLVVVCALLILAVGLLMVVGIERSTARSYVDQQRANLAAHAGFEDFSGILHREAANDDFLVLQHADEPIASSKKDPATYLYIARGSGGGDSLQYRYVPLFTVESDPTTSKTLKAPKPIDYVGTKPYEMKTHPWTQPTQLAWTYVKNTAGQNVSRYAYWVEDLQSRVDASTAGNLKDDSNSHKRYGWKSGDTSPYAHFPAPGLNAEESKPKADGRDEFPPLDQVALYALDPATAAKDTSDLDKTIIEGRDALVSPESVLAVGGISPPLARTDGHLTDPKAAALEENLSASVMPYDEQPVVPFAYGIDSSVTGKPKLNLNALIAKPADSAVNEMSAWIKKALPTFENRKGGFPEDYLKTLAASAIGYAAPGNEPVVQMGNYRGLGASPMISEIVLDTNYLAYTKSGNDKIMTYEFILFVELFNHTNLPIKNGNVSVSYEVGFNLPPIGPTPAGVRFDDSSIMDDPVQCTHDLVKSNEKYWSKSFAVNLAPGEYRFYKAATVRYTINIGSGSIGSNFVLTEPLGASGLSMKWNNNEVDRIPAIVRSSNGLSFSSGLRRYYGKAAIPGHSYGPYGSFINNMGDPRIAHYVTGIELGENAFPGNISPNRRNIRYETIYSKSGDPAKLKTYGRVIPSEWPDGGHDSQVTMWNTGWSDSREGTVSKHGLGPGFDPSAPSFTVSTPPQDGEAVTYLSDRKRYYSATELGRIYDPVMFLPTFDPASGLDSKTLRGDGSPTADAGIMPASGVLWPLVQINNDPSPYFGGGNTLRIGRPEHPGFNTPKGHVAAEMPATHAARLLDLFHAGKSRSEDKSLREGPVVRIEGQMNINTATRDSLRAMAAGYLTMDPKLSKRTNDNFDGRMAPAIQPLTNLSAPTTTREADLIADSVINSRPYSSPSELACTMTSTLKEVFGNTDLYPEKEKIQWIDSASEEMFGRVYEASTVRSRNYRIWVIGQSIAPTSATALEPEVLAESHKVFTVFADPGERKSTGEIDPTKFRVRILHENDF